MENNFDFINTELEIYEKNGLLIQENGTKLIGKAPHIAPMAWLHSIYQGLEIVDIKRTESELRTEIPKDYVELSQTD